MSRVDVVIPCYKYGRFLRSCVQSVLSQRAVEVRVLVIDDCSPDDTPEVGAALVAEDRRVEFRRHAVNRGHIATYNEGLLEWAMGDYCVLLSADDMLTPGALFRATALMDSNPDVVMTHGRGIRTMDPDREQPQDPSNYATKVTPGHTYIEQSCLDGGNLVVTPTAVVRTALQRQLGGYRPELPHTGDMEMWLRFAAHGSIGFIDAHQAIYRLHGQQMCGGFVGVADLRQRVAVIERLFSEYGDRIPGRDRLQGIARRSLSGDAFWSGVKCFESGAIDAYRECHDLAVRLHPGIKYSTSWWTFQARRVARPLLGSKATGVEQALRRWRRWRPALGAAGAA